MKNEKLKVKNEKLIFYLLFFYGANTSKLVVSIEGILMLEKLQNELKSAMKSGDKSRVTACRNMIGKLKSIQIDRGSKLEEKECRKIIQGMAKQVRDSIEQFKQGGRDDLVESESKELEIIESFLPQQLSEDEMRHIITGVIDRTGAAGVSDLGRVMPVVMGEIAGRGDGKLANQLVRELLTK